MSTTAQTAKLGNNQEITCSFVYIIVLMIYSINLLDISDLHSFIKNMEYDV